MKNEILHLKNMTVIWLYRYAVIQLVLLKLILWFLAEKVASISNGLKYREGEWLAVSGQIIAWNCKSQSSFEMWAWNQGLMVLEYPFSLPGADGLSLSLRQGRCLLEAFNSSHWSFGSSGHVPFFIMFKLKNN